MAGERKTFGLEEGTPKFQRGMKQKTKGNGRNLSIHAYRRDVSNSYIGLLELEGNDKGGP